MVAEESIYGCPSAGLRALDWAPPKKTVKPSALMGPSKSRVGVGDPTALKPGLRGSAARRGHLPDRPLSGRPALVYFRTIEVPKKSRKVAAGTATAGIAAAAIGATAFGTRVVAAQVVSIGSPLPRSLLRTSFAAVAGLSEHCNAPPC